MSQQSSGIALRNSAWKPAGSQVGEETSFCSGFHRAKECLYPSRIPARTRSYRLMFQVLVELLHVLLRTIFDIPTAEVLFDHDILLDHDFWDEAVKSPMGTPYKLDTTPVQIRKPHSEKTRLLHEQLRNTEFELDRARSQLDLAKMENRACHFDIARLTARVHDLEDELALSDRHVARQQVQIEQLEVDKENLERRNSGLWLINAGLRHDLTEMIVGKEDPEMVREVVREVEKEEWEELNGETLVEESSGSEKHMHRVSHADNNAKIDDGPNDDTDAMMEMTEDTDDIVEAAESAMDNLMIGGGLLGVS